jgi:hypothetical protein
MKQVQTIRAKILRSGKISLIDTKFNNRTIINFNGDIKQDVKKHLTRILGTIDILSYSCIDDDTYNFHVVDGGSMGGFFNFFNKGV